MDTFVEQLVEIRNTGKVKLTKLFIWIACIMLSLGLICFSILNPKWAFILSLVAIGSLYLAYYLSSQLNAEFEYIITNRDIDIDKIVNQRKRYRMASFTIDDILSIEKYDANRHHETKSSNINVYFGCTPNEESYAFFIKHSKKGHYVLVISPNDEVKTALKKFLPYTLKNSL